MEAPTAQGAGLTTEPTCGFPSCAAEATKTCTGCRAAWYCSPEHQKGHWKAHKAECRRGEARGKARGKAKAKGAEATTLDLAGAAGGVEGGGVGEGDAPAAGQAVGGAAGQAAAPEGKDPNVPARGDDGYSLVGGDDASTVVGGGDDSCSGQTEGRYDELQTLMKREDFHINKTRCGPHRQCPLEYALGYALDDPIDAKAVALVLGVDGVDVTSTSGTTYLMRACVDGKSQNVALLLADGRIDPNQADENRHAPFYATACFGRPRCLKLLLADGRADPNQRDHAGCTPVRAAVNFKTYHCLDLLLEDSRVDPNLADKGGDTPLTIAVDHQTLEGVERLLADPRVDPNHPDRDGYTPLNSAASEGRHHSVERLLADKRVDVCRNGADGQPPLLSACMVPFDSIHHDSIDQVGAVEGNDPARTLVIMLKSRRFSKRSLEETVKLLGQSMPTRREAAAAEAGGKPLAALQKTALLIVPVLMAQLKGDFRWCAHCYTLTPDVDLHRCGGCNLVGYCEEAPPGKTKPCHVLHWKAGHKQECARFAAEAEAQAKAEEEATEAEAAGGKGGAKSGGNGGAGGAGGGGGGGKKKGRGKKKKGR